MPNEIERVIASITNISVSSWGLNLTIEGVDDPFERNRYEVTYTNCKLIKWEMVENSSEELSSPCTALIGWETGEGNHKEPAVITADFFEISVWYEKYEINRIR